MWDICIFTVKNPYDPCVVIANPQTSIASDVIAFCRTNGISAPVQSTCVSNKLYVHFETIDELLNFMHCLNNPKEIVRHLFHIRHVFARVISLDYSPDDSNQINVPALFDVARNYGDVIEIKKSNGYLLIEFANEQSVQNFVRDICRNC